MPLNHSAHAHIAPCYVTTPTWHDYMHGSINLALLSLSLNSWLTKLRVLFVVHEGNLWLGLTSRLAESILSAESARSLGWATATDHDIQCKHRWHCQSSIFSSYPRDHRALARPGVQVTYSPYFNAVLVALRSYSNMLKAVEHEGVAVSEGSRLG